MKLSVFAQYHLQSVLNHVPDFDYITKVNLTNIPGLKPPLDSVHLADGRSIMSPLEHPEGAEYVGLLNGRSVDKYSSRNFSWEKLPGLDYTPDKVFAAWPTWVNTDHWGNFTEMYHEGMGVCLRQVLPKAGLPHWSCKAPSLWAHDFICHRSVWDDWRAFWRRAFWIAYNAWGWEPPFDPSCCYAERIPAYLYERFTTAYFSSRTDLTICQI